MSGSSGGIAGVWVPWAGEWKSASGTVSFDEGAAPVTPDMGFRATTATGLITCTMLMKAVDDDILALDEPVAEVVSGLPNVGDITLGQLCQGTSGLQDYYADLKGNFLGNPERRWSNVELVSDALASSRTGEPGARWSYSRAAILLVALALQESTGKSWSTLADEWVFEPLELEATRLPGDDELEPAGVLGGYATPGGDCAVVTDLRSQSPTIGGAASGAITDLDDLRVMTQVFAQSSLLSDESAAAQWATTVSMGDVGWQQYAIGAETYGPLRGTTGEQLGTLTAAYSDPESGLTVVVTLNNATSGPKFVRELAFALVSLASKAAPAEGRTAPAVGLPFALDQTKAHLNSYAKCPLPEPAG
nr:serine hydrolase domain-containing protein [Agromyces seonyuensis]